MVCRFGNLLVKCIKCRNPNLAKCGGEAQHLEKLGFGVLRDSRMFRARQQGAKHLALKFDSRPLKVGNRPAPDVRIGSVIRRWKDLDEDYNFGSNLVAIRGQGEEL